MEHYEFLNPDGREEPVISKSWNTRFFFPMISILGISSALLVVSEKGSKVVIESNACGDII